MKPLTRYMPGKSYTGDAYMTEQNDGQWYAKDEADARFAELEAEISNLRAMLNRSVDDHSDVYGFGRKVRD